MSTKGKQHVQLNAMSRLGLINCKSATMDDEKRYDVEGTSNEIISVLWPSRMCELVEEAKEAVRGNNTDADGSFHFVFDFEFGCQELFKQFVGGTGNWMVTNFAIRMTFAGTY